MTSHLAIRPVDLSPSTALTAAPVRGTATHNEDVQAIAPQEPVPVEQAVRDDESDAKNEKHANGVIRLLEAGHFRGVADVRLRINFFDELQSRREEAAAPVIEQAGETFTNTIADGINDVVASLGIEDALAEPIDAFTGTITTTLADFTGDTAAIEQSLRDAFGELLVSLQASLADDAPAGTGEGDPQTDGVARTAIDPGTIDTARQRTAVAIEPISLASPAAVDGAGRTSDATIAPIAVNDSTDTADSGIAPIAIADVTEAPDVAVADPNVATNEPDDVAAAPTLDESLASLQELFDTALTQLLAEIDTAQQPTALSEPNGNGSAYDKFVATYLNLLDGRSTLNAIA